MSKRKSRRNLNGDEENSEKEIITKRDVGTITEEQDEQHYQDETVEMSQSPVFHIHIHVPAESRQTGTQMYLPRIQPIIHLHYDELAKKLRKNKVLDKEQVNERYLKKIVSQATPKFGDILFHYNKSNSIGRDFNHDDRISSTPQKVSKSRNVSVNDLETAGKKNASKVIDNEVSESEMSDESDIDSYNGSTTESFNGHINDSSSNSSIDNTHGNANTESSNQVHQNDRPVKLKEAVVVLRDICKLKPYKDYWSGSVKNEMNDTVSSPVAKKIDNSDPQIKIEYESSSSRSNSPELRENQIEDSDNVQNQISGTNCSRTNIEIPKEEDFNSNKESLAALVEGCNFSEILRRFRGKNSQNLAESLKNSNCLTKSNDMVKTGSEDSTEKENNLHAEINVGPDNSHSADKIEQTKIEGNDSETNLTVNQIESNDTEMQLSIDKCKSKVGYYLELGDSYNYNCEGEMKVNEELNTITNDVKHVITTSNPVEENNLITTRFNLITKTEEDSRTSEFVTNDKFQNVVIKSEFGSEETMFIDNEIENGHENFECETVEEEITMKKQDTERKDKGNKTSRSNSNSPSPAKKKKTMEDSEKSKSRTINEDYIPLNTSGATKFSVAPLTSVHPYKTHDAKNFRQDMLFGNRVNRFNDPNQLRVYKMKKQAAGRRCD